MDKVTRCSGSQKDRKRGGVEFHTRTSWISLGGQMARGLSSCEHRGGVETALECVVVTLAEMGSAMMIHS